MRQPLQVAALALAAAALGVAVAYRLPPPQPVAACLAPASSMTRLELLFGTARKDGGELSETEWRAFLDAEVTPRFPDGLTVLTAYGQWRNSADIIIKENTKVLIIWHPPGDASDARVEAIRTAYKTRYGQESVMRVDGASCVSFQ